MPGKHLRLSSPTIAIQISDRHAITVPAGECITVLTDLSLEEQQLVEVEWNGATLRMFAADVRDRGESTET